MKLIKIIAESIECNIDEAMDKIETAYKTKEYDLQAAMWFKEMASAHIAFNSKAHDIISGMINAAKNS